ncbi:TBC1 domain family member 12-like [Oppia nitens]|uniref:TBC1 domain family member 12-like n=1 Tax=Oppia nitens TaxID=1686743 RepID=UPI0023DB9B6A|nr:TBC1 domain family member 12-like [Oppia nitens]
MCDFVHSINAINDNNNANDFNEKKQVLNVSQIKPINGKVLDCLPTNGLMTNGCTDNRKTCEMSSSMVLSDKETKCKGFVVSIETLDSPTIDAVLDKVPLVYDPITKQLLLQKKFVNNKGLNGYKNGVNSNNNYYQNGFKKLNGFTSLINDDNKGIHESNDKTISCDEYSANIGESCNDISCSDDLFNDNYRQSCTTNTGFIRQQESQSEDNYNNDNNNDLSVFESKKERSLLDEDNQLSTISDDNSTDNISNVDSSVQSLNLDDTESLVDSKPKKLFTLSFQSLINKVKKCSNNSITIANNNNNHNIGNNCANISSTTALILENRPSNLPAKPHEEDKKHKQEFEEMIRQTRKKKQKEMKVMKKLVEKQLQLEEQVIEAIKLWNEEILPNWQKTRSQKKTNELWWSGVPSLVRQRLWILAIGNDLNIIDDVYEQCVSRSKEKVWAKLSAECHENEDCCCGESTADLIKLDVSRTFPQLGLFQENGPYHDILSELLGAYVTYRPDIGYAQGMSFLAAMLLLNMESAQAFVCLANLLNNPLLVSFFRVNQPVMNAYYKTFEEFFKENLPKLYKHFNDHKLSPDLYLVDYIYTLFSRSLPLDIASRVWDLFLRDGDEFIFRAALGILSMYYEELINLDFIYLAQFLTKLPDDIDSDKLFSYILGIHMTVGSEKNSFSTVLSSKLLVNSDH